MFVISQDVLNKFGDLWYRSFVERSAAYLKEKYSAETSRYSDARLVELIKAGIERARRYAIERECDVIQFLELMVLLPADFDDPRCLRWPADILQSDRTSAQDKLDLIFDYLTHERKRSD